jgi:hypothetical protein
MRLLFHGSSSSGVGAGGRGGLHFALLVLAVVGGDAELDLVLIRLVGARLDVEPRDGHGVATRLDLLEHLHEPLHPELVHLHHRLALDVALAVRRLGLVLRVGGGQIVRLCRLLDEAGERGRRIGVLREHRLTARLALVDGRARVVDRGEHRADLVVLGLLRGERVTIAMGTTRTRMAPATAPSAVSSLRSRSSSLSSLDAIVTCRSPCHPWRWRLGEGLEARRPSFPWASSSLFRT